MWFTNLRIYTLKDSSVIDLEKLNDQLAQDAYSPIQSQELSKFGWKEPLNLNDGRYYHQVGNDILITALKEDKILPASVIKQQLQEKIAQLEEAQNRKLSKAEKTNLKEEIIITLLPRAFSRFSQTWLWIDIKNSRIIVNTASAKRAEELLSLLRKSIHTLPIIPLSSEMPLEQTMTNWLIEDKLPHFMQYLQEVELKSLEQDGAVVRCKQHELQSEEITLHIENGKQISQMGISWREKIDFVLTGDYVIKRLKYSNIIKEQNADIKKDDYIQRFDADFVLMTGEISVLVNELIEYI